LKVRVLYDGTSYIHLRQFCCIGCIVQPQHTAKTKPPKFLRLVTSMTYGKVCWVELIVPHLCVFLTVNVCGLSDVTVTREDSASDEQDVDEV